MHRTIALLFLILIVACNETPQRLQSNFFVNTQPTCEEGQVLNEETNECVTDTSSNKDVKSLRPDKAINVVTSCACQNAKSITFGQECENFCSSKSSTEALLYIELSPDASISLNESIKTVQNWCNVDLDDNGQVPLCRMEVVDVNSNLVGSVTQTSGNLTTDVTGMNIFNNNITLNLSRVNMLLDNTYYLKFSETSSGSTWTKDIQVSLKDLSGEKFNYGIGPLNLLPVNQYTCILRRGSTNSSGDQRYLVQYPFFYYFTSLQTPQSVPTGVESLVCHDYQTSPIDREDIPRLQLTPDVFRLWNPNDPRFADERNSTGEFESDSITDIENYIQYKLSRRGASTNNANTFFFKRPLPHMPNSIIDQLTNSNTSQDAEDNVELGYMLSPFIDRENPVNNTYLSFCPTGVHYNSQDPLFQILGDLLGTDTEGIYLARSEVSTVFLDNNQPVYIPSTPIFIRENILHKIWFFINPQGLREKPTNENVMNKTVHFYWPPKANYAEPLVRGEGQKLYTVVLPSNDGQTIQTHDGKIGCVPTSGN